MIDHDKKMDELLRNRLEQFSAQPPERVWQKVGAAMAQGKPPAKTVYLRWLAAAAVLVLALITGILLNNQDNEITPGLTEIVEPALILLPDTVEIFADENVGSLLASDLSKTKESEHSQPVSVHTIDDAISHSTDTGRPASYFAALKSIRPGVKSILSFAEPLAKVRSEIVRADNLTDADKMIVASNLLHGSAEPLTDQAWKVGMHISPGYSSHNASHSQGYASNMTYADSDVRANMGAGFSVQFKTSSRWSVESGLYYSQTGGRSGNSFRFNSMMYADFAEAPRSAEKYFNTTVTNQMGQLAMNSTAGVILFSRTPTNAELISMPESSLGLATGMLTPGEFQQVFEFVEVPLFARYRIIESKIDVEWIGGISANILSGNNVYMESTSGRERVGTTQDISSLNFSGTTGVGLVYAMGKNLSLSVEPRFSYYLNSINRSGDVNFKPWRIGVFTGLSYEF